MSETVEAATPEETRGAILRLQGRGYTQVRNIAVQLHDEDPSGSRASTVAKMISGRRHRALILYLLLLAAWNGLANRDRPFEAGVWVRALTSGETGALTWSPSTLSRSWADLEELGLVSRTRTDRLVRVIPRREDGLADYEKPGGRSDPDNRYFVLPDAFWHDGWFAKLSLPALGVLLVIAKETNTDNEVHRTYKQFQDWYGIYHKTAEKGVRELVAAGLLSERRETVKAPLSKIGSTTHIHYSLTGDFGHAARSAMKVQARKEHARRTHRTQSSTLTGTTQHKEATL